MNEEHQNPDFDLDEIKRIKEQYKRRDGKNFSRYGMLNPDVYKSRQEKERALVRWLKYSGLSSVVDKLKLLEIGSGYGDNLLDFIRLGFDPKNLTGNDIIHERVETSGSRLPSGVKIIECDAAALNLPENNFDVVFQSMVFSSILGIELRVKLADKMWRLAKPGGGILWYDFIYDNPQNEDVKGIPVRQLKSYFPSKEIKIWKITLAPPIARPVSRLNPNFYNLLNLFPLLRTHVLCWVKKAI